MCAKFHFVDLAGSERANRTGNVGERFKGDIITAHFSFVIAFHYWSLKHITFYIC